MREVRDRDEILAALAAEDRYLHLYEIGDLDDFFFPHTRWFAPDRGAPPLALLYTGTELPVLLALTSEHHDSLAHLLRELPLPSRVYSHLTPRLLDALGDRYDAEPHGHHAKMALRDPMGETAWGNPLGVADRDRLEGFFRDAYPGNWFDPRMLETGVYRAIIEGDRIVAAGGIHVFSKYYRVAALGNIAVHPRARGRGLGASVTASVVHALIDAGIEHIGLNVKLDNHAAIKCYERLGFSICALYDEYMLTRR